MFCYLCKEVIFFISTFVISVCLNTHACRNCLETLETVKLTFIFINAIIFSICIISSFLSSFLAPSLHLCTIYIKIEIDLIFNQNISQLFNIHASGSTLGILMHLEQLPIPSLPTRACNLSIDLRML